MTDHIASTETTTPSRLRLVATEEQKNDIAVVAALEMLINARPPYNS